MSILPLQLSTTAKSSGRGADGVGTVFWTASGKVLDGVKKGAGRRRTRCWTASSKVPDGVEEGAGRRLANRPTPSRFHGFLRRVVLSAVLALFVSACLPFCGACLVSVRLDSAQPRLHDAHRAISASLRPLDIHKYVFGSKSCRTRRDARRPFGWRRRIKPRMALSSAFGLVGGSRVARYRDFVRRLPRHSRRYASPGVVASRRGVRYAWRRS